MKRGQFLKHLIKKGCYLKRHDARHDIYANTHSGRCSPVPRHPEIKESLCKLIKKQLGID
ncbi:MAG: type II toxin-antitoxin system HicA family toxin [Spirochaetes bacterium]|nr:type II toxin-antitoxin system HicA family toxin [Spirochaetota bacterium]